MARVITCLAILLAAVGGLSIQALARGAGPAPDYAKPHNWALEGHNGASHPADVFYIHPTTFVSQDWNERMDDQATRAWTIASVADRQANAFMACCNVYMPFYRQASSHAFFDHTGRGTKAYDFAYRDVLRAFRYWLSQHPDRPFIIAGHSQGSLLGLRLVKEVIAGSPLAKRMIAAYLPGIGIPLSALPKGIPACDTPSQTGCVVSWNGFTPDADASAWRKRSVSAYGTPGGDNSIICINPLTFDAAQPRAGFELSKGMLPPASKTKPPAPMFVHAVSARCNDGVLRVETAPGISATPLPNGSYHMYDIGFFWANISANAVERTQQWIKEHAQP